MSCPAGCYAESGDLQRAQQCYQRAIAAKRAALGPAHAAVSASLVALSQLLARQGRAEAAAQALQEQPQLPGRPGAGRLARCAPGSSLRAPGDYVSNFPPLRLILEMASKPKKPSKTLKVPTPGLPPGALTCCCRWGSCAGGWGSLIRRWRSGAGCTRPRPRPTPAAAPPAAAAGLLAMALQEQQRFDEARALLEQLLSIRAVRACAPVPCGPLACSRRPGTHLMLPC